MLDRTSYFAVRKAGPFWRVSLVTPHDGGALRTTLYEFSDEAEAVAQAEQSAERTGLLFKRRGIVQ
jgi:hypothetical protein